jgi:hypothetical protein
LPSPITDKDGKYQNREDDIENRSRVENLSQKAYILNEDGEE